MDLHSRRAIGRCLLIVLGLGVCFTSTAESDLVPTINTDTATNLKVTWVWTEAGTEDSQAPATNWNVDIGVFASGSVWTVSTQNATHHVTNPHVGDTTSATPNLSVAFFDSFVTPPTPDSATVNHSGVGHKDKWQLIVTHNNVGPPHVNSIVLTGSHVPEPASFAMFALFGIAMLGMSRRRRQR